MVIFIGITSFKIVNPKVKIYNNIKSNGPLGWDSGSCTVLYAWNIAPPVQYPLRDIFY